MFTWSGTGLDIGVNMGSRLLWEEAGWSVASAFGIFFALRTGLPVFAFAGAGVSLWAWVQSRRHYRAIADIPTSRLSPLRRVRWSCPAAVRPCPNIR